MKPQIVLQQQRQHDNDITLRIHHALCSVHTPCRLVIMLFIFDLSSHSNFSSKLTDICQDAMFFTVHLTVAGELAIIGWGRGSDGNGRRSPPSRLPTRAFHCFPFSPGTSLPFESLTNLFMQFVRALNFFRLMGSFDALISTARINRTTSLLVLMTTASALRLHINDNSKACNCDKTNYAL